MEENKIASLHREIAAEQKQFAALVRRKKELNDQSKGVTAAFRLGIAQSKEFLKTCS